MATFPFTVPTGQPAFGCCRFICLIAVLVSFAGCSFKQKIAENAIDYNQSMEMASNRLTLLNVIRGSHRNPMYFTRVGQVTGLLTSEATATTEATFNRGSGAFPDQAVGVSSTGTLASSPTFVIQNLESQEFYRGILKPLTGETLEYYWDQGWPKEILFHLFVERLDLLLPGGTACYLQPYPPDEQSFEAFDNYVTEFIIQGPILTLNPEASKFGPPIPVSTAGTGAIQGLVQAFEAKLGVADESDAIQLKSETKKYYFRFPSADTTDTEEKLKEKQIGKCEDDENFDRIRGQDIPKIKFDVHPRAPQGIIYYLGEVARAQIAPEKDKEPYVPKVRIGAKKGTKDGNEVPIGGDEVPLFRVVENPTGETFVSVSYRGKRFGIPEAEDDVGRSMQVMALLHQVFALSTSAKDLPSAETIRIAN